MNRTYINEVQKEIGNTVKVQGFIENHAQNYKLSGLWKVYGDEAYARAAFAKYKKCTDIYCRRWRSGASLEALTVAS